MKELRMRDVSYVYRQGKHEMPVFSGVNLTFEAGRLYVVTGSAGSGRTTLLQLLAGLIAPETGWLELDGRRVRRWQISRYRRDVATMLFEKNNLMMQADVAENIAMPLRIQGKSRARAVQEALGFLDSVALPRGIASMTPAMLSGGDQQRVAIARALAADSQILLAAEPARNLDVENAAGILRLIDAFAHREGRCAVIATADETLAAQADARIVIEGGNVREE
ncbi:MAG: ABC transporter ATP-binding protein [Candidatus Aphodomonas sp.]|nr:ABC transporter ATP-binding protein [Candidatus Aphodomonas sp.]